MVSPVLGSLSGLLRRSARRFADRPALTGAGTALTYAELDARVDALAGRFRAAGAEPGQRVGLCVERGPLPLVASAALMRLGCAYVPLDPRNPVDRIRHIVADAGMAAAVCDAGGRRALTDTSLDLVDVHEDDLLPGGPRLPASREATPGPEAYVMYTSGSTGRPKGVAITHANVLALLSDAVPLFPFGEDEVWPLQHAHGFDVSVWEMWAGIAVGATLVAVEGEAGRNPELLAELMLRHRATRLHVVPSVFAQLAEAVAEERLRVPLRGVTFCGEPLNYRAMRTWVDAHPGMAPAWYNVYGITETTVYNTFAEIAPHELTRADPATPIGQGYRHSPVVVLDEDHRPAPHGTVGEIFVGGRQVARGYVNNPELSASRFLEVPDRPGRWYRTGDFGHLDPEGDIRFHGRRDDQVKIRGFRIELGELDHAARALSWVTDAAAVVDTSARGEPVLVLFVVTPEAGADLRGRVRAELATWLPDHLLPARVVRVGELPTNTNGKRDRRALSALLTSTTGG
ncbi:amino acid adenylation domain-containing protein [Actinophytocola xanthii]|nr:amino acid adenylation domain-containing protein [Actinophytocola xanthii]